jgi:hypothetical protein
LPVSNTGRKEYLRAVIEADSNNAQLKSRLARMLAPPTQEATPTEDQIEDEQPAPAEIIPGTCQ